MNRIQCSVIRKEPRTQNGIQGTEPGKSISMDARDTLDGVDRMDTIKVRDAVGAVVSRFLES